jgi:hypothetical protein
MAWLRAAAARAARRGHELPKAIGVTFDGDDLGIVDEAVDQRDDASAVWEHLAPFGERPISGDPRALALITPRDEFGHEVGMAVGTGEIPTSSITSSCGRAQWRSGDPTRNRYRARKGRRATGRRW